MFTIQYVDPATRTSKMETPNAKTTSQLLSHVASFKHEILAIYEQSTPVTKRVRTQLAAADRSNLSHAARDFVDQGIRFKSPA